MSSLAQAISVLTLTGCLVLIVGTILAIKGRTGRLLSFRVALLTMTAVVVPVSGIVHVTGMSESRGFYDLHDASNGDYSSGSLEALLATIAITIVSCLVASRRLPEESAAIGKLTGSRKPDPGLDQRQLRFCSRAAIVLIPISAVSVLAMKAFAEETGSSRIVQVDGGMARYAFLSHWFAWGVAFLAIWLALGAFQNIPKAKVATVLVAVALIAWSLDWTGGRSIIAVLGLPIVLALLPQIRRYAKFALTTLVAAAVITMVSISRTRAEGYRSSEAFSIPAVLDWQWGRFSMLGFAAENVKTNGYMFGETVLSGVMSVPNGILTLIGVDLFPQLRSSMEITGQEILGDPSQKYILPGLAGELYLNFGILGVIVLHYVLGRLANAADDKFRAADTELERLIYGYWGTLLVLSTVPAQSGAIFNYGLFSGLPIIVAWVYMSQKSSKTADGVNVAGIKRHNNASDHNVKFETSVRN